MGGCSSKTTLFGKKKKKSPLDKTLKRLKMGLLKRKSSKKKKKKRSLLQKLNPDKQKKNSQKIKSKTKDKKKERQSFNGFFLGKLGMDLGKSASEIKQKEKDREGSGGLGDKLKKKLSPDKVGLGAKQEVVTEEENQTPLQKLKDKMRVSRVTETKAH